MNDPIIEAKRELTDLANHISSSTTLEQLRSIFYRVDEIAKFFPADFEIQLAAGDIKQGIATAGARLGGGAAADPPRGPGTPPARPAGPPRHLTGSLPTAPIAAAIKGNIKASSDPPRTAKPEPERRSQAAKQSKLYLYLWAGLAIVALLAAGAAGWLAFRQRMAPKIVVRIQTTPAGASVLIDGQPRCTSAVNSRSIPVRGSCKRRWMATSPDGKRSRSLPDNRPRP